MLRETLYREEEGELLAGQIVAIGTDGIWEARNGSGEMFGKERFKAVLRERVRAGDEARAILDAVFDAVREFTAGAGLADDVTLVVIRCGVKA